jgi:hypothetical protein
MIEDQVLDITHNLGIALVSISGNGVEPLAGFLRDGCRLGMQHEGDCEETLFSCLNKRIMHQTAGKTRTLIHSI